MKTLIISATRSSVSDSEDLQLVKSLKSFTDPDLELALTTNYKVDGLPQLYNSYLTKSNANEFDCFLYVHDDVFIDDLKAFNKIEEMFKSGIDVVGLAGASSVKLKKPALWHLMSEQSDWSGAVAHPAGRDSIHVTSFGAIPKRCLIMDGLFLAVKPSKLLSKKVTFDEQFKFHHYDIDFCLSCNKAGLKMSTCNINVIHSSPGLTNYQSDMFQNSEQKFVDKYVKA